MFFIASDLLSVYIFQRGNLYIFIKGMEKDLWVFNTTSCILQSQYIEYYLVRTYVFCFILVQRRKRLFIWIRSCKRNLDWFYFEMCGVQKYFALESQFESNKTNYICDTLWQFVKYILVRVCLLYMHAFYHTPSFLPSSFVFT